MILMYLLICTVFFLLGLVVEQFILCNDITPSLIVVHAVMWYVPLLNVLSAWHLFGHIRRWYSGT